MPDCTFRQNFWTLLLLLVGATVVLNVARTPPKLPLRKPLTTIPLNAEDWRGTDFPIEKRLLVSLAVDDYLNRGYSDSDGNSLEFYVGYFGNQRSGELIHSPKNCLPAAGWEWVRTGTLDLSVQGGRTVRVNDVRIAKGLQKSLVLYWYH